MLKSARCIILNPITIYFMIISAALFSYFHGLKGEFLGDDTTLVAKEPFYYSPDSSYTECWNRTYWQGLHSTGLYRPLVGFSYLLNARISGVYSPAFRIVNLILHILISILLYKLAIKLKAGKITAIFASMIYAVHPLHTEAVIPTCGRAELLCAFFILTGLISFIKIIRKTGKRVLYILPPAALLMAMWSKENGIILFPLCILYDMIYHQLSLKKIMNSPKAYIQKRIFIYGGLSAAFCAVIVSKLINIGYLLPIIKGRINSAIDNPLIEASLLERLCTALKIQGMIFWKYFWPAHLSHDYSFAEIVPVDNIYNWYALLALFMFFIIPLIAYRIVPGGKKLILFLTAAYIISILPAGNFIVTTGTILGERLYYTPSIFFIIGSVFIILRLSQKISKQTTPKTKHIITAATSIFFTAAIIAGGTRTYTRSFDWESQSTLSTKGVETAPNSIKTWGNLGVEYADSGDIQTALLCCDKALAIQKSNRTTLRNKSRYLIRLKKYREAELCLRELIREQTEDAEDFNNLAWLMQLQGKLPESIRLLKHSLKMDPNQQYIRKGLKMTERALKQK
jgi:tetratricopeptide (TPR) repeat protein